LVADSFSKVVIGPAFERALQDLGVLAEVQTAKGGGGLGQDKDHARVAMLVGATLLSGAAAAEGEEQGGDDLSWLWTTGIILMCVGAVYVANKAVRSSIWLYRDCWGHRAAVMSTESKDMENHLMSEYYGTAVAAKKKTSNASRSTRRGQTMCLELRWKRSTR
jgi:hypothetical protein